jgi:hypothetical protein
VAEKLGMKKVGVYVKVHNNKEMPHDVYVLEKTEFA